MLWSVWGPLFTLRKFSLLMAYVDWWLAAHFFASVGAYWGENVPALKDHLQGEWNGEAVLSWTPLIGSAAHTEEQFNKVKWQDTLLKVFRETIAGRVVSLADGHVGGFILMCLAAVGDGPFLRDLVPRIAEQYELVGQNSELRVSDLCYDCCRTIDTTLV